MEDKEKHNFYCEKCRYGCKYNGDFEKHCSTTLHLTGKRKTRKDRKENPYKCKECEYTTRNRMNYEVHYLNNHSDEKTRKEKFKYYCNACRFGANTKSLYDRHTATARHEKMIG